MSFIYSIPDILRSVGVFGYAPAASAAINKLLQAKSSEEYKVAQQDAITSIYFPGGAFPDLPKFQPVLLEKQGDITEDLLLDSAIVSFGQPKNVVKTPVAGRDGTFKEFIADGDFEINIKGAIAFNGQQWPKDEVLKLRQYLKLKKAIGVIHERLNAFGIYEMVITDYKINESPFFNLQPYEITAVSEEPFEMMIKE